jgi:hypothetical protein
MVVARKWLTGPPMLVPAAVKPDSHTIRAVPTLRRFVAGGVEEVEQVAAYADAQAGALAAAAVASAAGLAAAAHVQGVADAAAAPAGRERLDRADQDVTERDSQWAGDSQECGGHQGPPGRFSKDVEVRALATSALIRC